MEREERHSQLDTMFRTACAKLYRCYPDLAATRKGRNIINHLVLEVMENASLQAESA